MYISICMYVIYAYIMGASDEALLRGRTCRDASEVYYIQCLCIHACIYMYVYN